MNLVLINLRRLIKLSVFACFFLIEATGFTQDPLSTWNEVFSSPFSINSMAYGNGTYVGVGQGFRAISHDGSNWSVYVSAPVLNQAAIAYGNGKFIVFGTNTQSTATVIFQSTNGLDYSPLYTNSKSLFAVAFGNNTWVFVGTNDILTAAVTSSNLNWMDYPPAFSPTCVTYANGQFILGAYNGSGSDLIFSSTDGLLWTYLSQLYMRSSTFNGIAYGNGVYVATTFVYGGYSSTEGYYYNAVINSSTNLVNWTATCTNFGTYTLTFTPITGASVPIMFGGREFYTDFPTQYGGAFSSFDGYTWNPAGGENFISFAYGQGTFVASSDYFDNGLYQSAVVTNENNPPPSNLAISTFAGVSMNGTAGLTYQIQCTTNLNSSWTTLTNFTLPYSPYLWIDTSTTVVGQKFYRSVQIQ